MFFSQRIGSDGKYIFYIKATDANDKKAWYFVQVRPEKLISFKAVLQHGAYIISDYGQVLQSGFGLSAPVEITAAINHKFNCEFKP